jgi:hypothetical protein
MTATEQAPVELVPKDAELPTKRADLPDIWQSFEQKVAKFKLTAETLTVTDVTQKAEMKLARQTRLALKDLRVEIENRRRELGEAALREKQRIDGAAKKLKEAIEPLETRLLEQEQFEEREQARIEEEKRVARTAEITPLLSGPILIDLGKMPDAEYAKVLQDAKDAQSVRLARELKEKQDAEAAAKAEADRIEAQRIENERLKAELEKAAADRKAAEEAAAIAAEKARVEREAIEAAAKAQREADAKAAREAKEKADKERAAAEAEAAALLQRELAKARAAMEAAEKKVKAERDAAMELAVKEREAIEAKNKAEREAREKAEAELAERKRAEDEAKKKARAAAEAAKMAPEKDKLMVLAVAIRMIQLPTLETEKGLAAMAEITAKVEAFAAWVEKRAGLL